MKNHEFTSGIVAQVWRKVEVSPEDEARQAQLVKIEHRLERAIKLVHQIEKRAKEAEERLKRTEQRFNSLKNSFYSLRQEWQEHKEDPDNKD